MVSNGFCMLQTIQNEYSLIFQSEEKLNEEDIQPPNADDLKERGNECVKNKSYTEAILHYTHAIKMSPTDPILYSNRSLAFLKMKQLYYANEDAEKTISLKPDWAKGYFRKAEVHVEAGQYDTALISYGQALQLQRNDQNILIAAKKAADLSQKQTDCKKNIMKTGIVGFEDKMHVLDFLDEKVCPWLGAGVGIIFGVIIVLADQLMTKRPTINVSGNISRITTFVLYNLWLI